jgi:2-phospho-L-lactate guanylyltransferase
MRTLAVLPVKRFQLAKQRLSAELSPEFRHALAEAMIADVLSALAACPEVEATLVISNEPAVAVLAARYGAEAIPDPHESGQSAAATVGLVRAVADGYDRALLVPGDCPAIDPDELTGLLGDARAGTSVVIVPDRHGLGTNALLLCPPNALAPTFGPGSCRRHQERAAAAGAVCRVAQVPSLLLDVDTPRDLEVLREALEIRSGHATQTRAVLEGGAPAVPSGLPPVPRAGSRAVPGSSAAGRAAGSRAVPSGFPASATAAAVPTVPDGSTPAPAVPDGSTPAPAVPDGSTPAPAVPDGSAAGSPAVPDGNPAAPAADSPAVPRGTTGVPEGGSPAEGSGPEGGLADPGVGPPA